MEFILAEYLPMITREEREAEKLAEGRYAFKGSAGIEVLLDFKGADKLIQFAQIMHSHSPGDSEMCDVSNLILWSAESNVRSFVLRCFRKSQAESLSMTRSSDPAQGPDLIWAGDSEYWLECYEKCEALAQTGGAFQELMIRGRADQQVTVSLDLNVAGQASSSRPGS